MPMRTALMLCPNAIVLHGDMEKYSRYSNLVTEIIAEKAPIYEKASIDEHYLDISGMDKFFGCDKWAHELRAKIIKETGLPISFGHSINKTVSKIATGEAKPNGEIEVRRDVVLPFLDPLSISKIPMIGQKTYHVLRSMGIATSGLRAQAGRMRVISENIANADSTAQTAGGDPHRLTSMGVVSNPQFSPDGTKIAFESDRSGYQEIWVCNRDGSNTSQITSMAGYAGTPRWSPDSRFLAFDFRPKEHSEIYVVEVPAGTPRQITTVPGANNVVPSWSRDGQWVYFASRGGEKDFQVWKVPIQGGPAVQMTKKGGFAPLEGDDGFLYYTKGFSIPGIWKVPNHGGTELAVLDTSDAPQWSEWAVVPGGMYFVSSRSSSKPILEFFDFATARRTSISALDGETQGLAVSPDQKSILYAQLDLDNQAIVVVKNFH